MKGIKTLYAMDSGSWLAALLIGAALGLTGCDQPPGERSAGEKVDSAIARTERAAEDAKAKADQMASDAKNRMQDPASRVADAAKEAGNAVTMAADDATITAAVSASLARDPDLSAVQINVDTQGGKVTLRGPAPNPMAKSRAEQIAKNVKGVSAVDNQLEVKTM